MPDVGKNKTTKVQKPKLNRKHKDSIFVDLLTYKEENIRQVCEALDESITTEPIEILRLENTVYTGLQNDVSCLVGNRLMLLIEHQSTINPNMPMRCFLYAARLYESIINKEDRYSKVLKKYPNGECYTFYNGEEAQPAYQELRLSNSFIDKKRKPTIELIVKVFNINYSEDNEFLKSCPILNEYAQFVHRVKMNRQDKHEGYDKAVKSCLEDGILEEYLNMRTRVINSMLVSEYDPELHMKVRLQEAKQEGRQEGRQEGMQQEKVGLARSFRDLGVAVEKIMQATGLSKEEIERL